MNRIIANILKEDHNKALIKFISVFEAPDNTYKVTNHRRKKMKVVCEVGGQHFNIVCRIVVWGGGRLKWELLCPSRTCTTFRPYLH